jgi:putative endonuclease
MPAFYVYILQCFDNNGKRTYYTGSTDNLLNRINQHQKGTGAKYTRGKELQLAYYETLMSRSEAMKREYAIKNLPIKKKYQMIEDFQKRMKEGGITTPSNPQ